jgi:uncharacterized protein YcfJ
MKFKEVYFHTVVIAVCASFLSSVAFADSSNVMGQTKDHYKTVIQQKPYTVEVCKDVAVSGDKTVDTLTGAIIGGVIGHQIDHKDGAKIGGVLGGIIGNKNSNATGNIRRQCQTETRYEEEQITVYSHSTITFWNNGREYTLRFNR